MRQRATAILQRRSLFYCPSSVQARWLIGRKGSNRMATYALDKVRQLWQQEALTDEQMLGHLLQHLELLTEQVQALQKAVRALQQERKA
jgi:hypothetical protein